MGFKKLLTLRLENTSLFHFVSFQGTVSLTSTKTKSLLEEDAYFKANLPPTYGQKPTNNDKGLIPVNKEETVLGKNLFSLY